MMKKLISSLALGAMLAAVPTAAMADVMTIDLGNSLATVNGNDYQMQGVAGVDEEGMILVPVRDVAEALGGTVVYDNGQNMVQLTFPNGNWAYMELLDPAASDAKTGEEQGMMEKAVFIQDRLYVPAAVMATCLGGRVEMIDYQQGAVFRLIYSVR